MKKLQAAKLNHVVMVSFLDKDGNTNCITLRKLNGKWKCPTMTYTKITPARHVAAYGLKKGWEPTPKMVGAAEKALKS